MRKRSRSVLGFLLFGRGTSNSDSAAGKHFSTFIDTITKCPSGVLKILAETSRIA